MKENDLSVTHEASKWEKFNLLLKLSFFSVETLRLVSKNNNDRIDFF